MVKTVMVDWSLLRPRPLCRPRKANVKAFIQARIGSTRLPNKIYKQLNGAPLLFHTINKAKQAKSISDVIVLSPQKLPDIPEGIKEFVWAGDENDVLSRYFHATKEHPCDYIVRLTSDCPLLDFHLIDFVVANSIGFDYGSNVLTPTFPDGADVEVISNATLGYLHETATGYDREHVTTLLRDDPVQQIKHDMVSIQAIKDQSYLKMSVDTQEDYERVCQLENALCR